MNLEEVTLYDTEDKVLDVVKIPLNSVMEPGAVLTHMGKKFARGGGPDSFYGANEYAELRTDEDRKTER